jgi:hypothetical protein
MNQNIKVLLSFALALSLVPSNAFAYLDPGSGSMIFQGIVAAFFGGLFIIKTYWHKILRALGLKKDSNSDDKK